ncbi:Brix-domain-containing protein [Ramicandelaber brevisporus]|nr:Brix-domain-containing protein [Ramicandelaber brevisporus]
MDEMRMTGNCLKGSRPLLSFDKTFDSKPHYQLLKEMLIQSFGVPKSSRRVKPFHDHIFNFAIVDGRIWFRNYQIVEKDNAGTVLPIDEETNKILTNAENGDDDDEPSGKNKKKATEQDLTMVEIGPRFCLNPIKIFAGSFGGPTLYENQAYVSPNAVRAELRGRKGAKYVQRHMAESERKIRLDHSDLPQDARDSIFANNDNDDDDDE